MHELMHNRAIRFSLASSDVPPSIKGRFSAENKRAAPCRCPQSYSWFRCYRNPQFIADKGRMGWQKASGYNRRARIEATMGRFKGVIGDGLRSRTDQRRATEVKVAVHVLNRMLELGRPESVRIA